MNTLVLYLRERRWQLLFAVVALAVLLPLAGPALGVAATVGLFFGISGGVLRERLRADQARAAKESQGLRAMYEKSPECVTLTQDGRIVYANQAMLKLLGFEQPESLLGREVLELLLPEEREEADKKLRKVFESTEPEALHSRRLLRVDNSVALLEVTLLPVQLDGRPAVATVGRDVTGRVQARLALEHSEERYALAVQGANDGLWDWNLVTNEVFYSPRWKSMLKIEEEIGTGSEEWFDRVHPEDLHNVKKDLANHVNGDTLHFESEHRLVLPDESSLWVLARGVGVRDETGKVIRIAGSITDISDRKRVEEKLLHIALHDKLTHLPNRALLVNQLTKVIRRARRQPSLFAVLFMDLDRFKYINDSLGHNLGDQLLVAMSRRLSAVVRADDTVSRPGSLVARLGGDEFVVLLENLNSPEDALRIANRIQDAISKPFLLNGREVYTSSSIGISLSTVGYERAEDMLRDADTAMYRAKESGKATQRLFDCQMHAQALETLEMEADLRRAVERNELKLFYQPIVHVGTGEITGFEALVRWLHPTRGVVSPADFIPLAEETGLIHEIGLWVLEMACKQAYEWEALYPKAPPLTMNVNVSPKQFEQDDFVEKVDAILRKTGMPAACLKFEITETMLMGNPDMALDMLNELKERGIVICMDDFGTGYSSLSHLHRYPFDTLKIDRAFVSTMCSDSENAEIVRAISALGKSLNLGIVAEGVETDDQMHRLRDLECDFAQGYLFSQPVTGDVATQLISSSPRWMSGDLWDGGRQKPRLYLAGGGCA